jgi:hypothetical protein
MWNQRPSIQRIRSGSIAKKSPTTPPIPLQPLDNMPQPQQGSSTGADTIAGSYIWMQEQPGSSILGFEAGPLVSPPVAQPQHQGQPTPPITLNYEHHQAHPPQSFPHYDQTASDPHAHPSPSTNHYERNVPDSQAQPPPNPTPAQYEYGIMNAHVQPTPPDPVPYDHPISNLQALPTPPLPIPVQYEQVTPVPPPIQYPAEDETAWYQAALNLDPQQTSGETYQPPPVQQQPEHYPAPPPMQQYPSYEGYRNLSLSFDTAGVGPNPHALSPSIAPSGSSLAYPPPPLTSHHGYSPMSGPIGLPGHTASMGYDYSPGPYASQAKLPFHSAPVTMPIYQHTSYSTPAIDGYRPGLVHEGTYPGPSSSGSGTYHHPFPESYNMAPTTTPTHIHPGQMDYSFPLNDQNQSQQRSSPYTFPSASIPLPDSAGSYFDRPPIPRAVSNPTNLNAVSESTTPSQSDGSASLAPTTTTVNVSVPEGEYYPQNMNVMYETGPSKIDKLSERLGEFFLGPEKQDPPGAGEGASTGRHIKKSRKSVSGGVGMSYSPSHESDGLTETARNALYVCQNL